MYLDPIRPEADGATLIPDGTIAKICKNLNIAEISTAESVCGHTRLVLLPKGVPVSAGETIIVETIITMMMITITMIMEADPTDPTGLTDLTEDLAADLVTTTTEGLSITTTTTITEDHLTTTITTTEDPLITITITDLEPSILELFWG